MRKKISKTSLLSIFFISLSGCESLSPDVPVIPDALSYLGLYSAAPVAHETTSLLNGPLPKDPRLSNKSLARGPIKQIIFYKGCEEHCTENDFKNRYVFDKKNRLIKEETYFSSDYTRTETLSYKDDFKNPSTRENRSSNTGLLSKREYRLDKYGNTVSYIKTDSKGETTTYQAFVKKKGNETILTTTQPHHSAQNNVLHYSNGRLRSIEYEGNLTIN
ncbi:hypothetical protein, partial [Halomonas sp. AOP35-4E-18]|uniref:hypothetical protein n=1 Tax=Halomonas sp. AOP35-4E-18 TaxID=3457686 RepID=UPI004033E87A